MFTACFKRLSFHVSNDHFFWVLPNWQDNLSRVQRLFNNRCVHFHTVPFTDIFFFFFVNGVCSEHVLHLIGHFRVPKTLTFKMRPSAQPVLWKWVLFTWEWKIISISKADHLTLFSYRGPRVIGNGLLEQIFSLRVHVWMQTTLQELPSLCGCRWKKACRLQSIN